MALTTPALASTPSPLRRFRRSTTLTGGVSLLALAFAAGCGDGGQTGDEHRGELIQELRGDAPRVAANGGVPSSATADGWAFGWKLYGEEATAEANTFFSPYSIQVAAGMLVAGAAGETRSEIQSALEFSTEGEAFHQAQNSVAQALEARNHAATAENNAQTLRVSNDFWVDPTFRPTESFLDVLSAYYGASTFLAPFSTDPEGVRGAINEKVATDTEQLIPELLPGGSLTIDTVFVLTNALYMKARWSSEFPKPATANAPFQLESGTTTEVPMMRATLGGGYVATSEYEAISLDYDRGELELIALMPAAGTFTAFIETLTAESVSSIAAALAPTQVDLRFPKFGIENSVPLKDRLMALGMVQAFDLGGADFSNLSDAPASLSDAFHDATLRLDEEGTEAAAATAFVGVGVSAPLDPIPVTFDHPFVFLIRDVQTDALLFIGHLATP